LTCARSESVTELGAGIRIKGKVKGEEALVVRGRIEGSIEVSDSLTVEHEGVVRAEVFAREITVKGTVAGRMSAEGLVELQEGSKTAGDIQAGSVAIRRGAFYRGKITRKSVSGGKE
jgi:cytoskeletal protein CcmA (bactofilin family)